MKTRHIILIVAVGLIIAVVVALRGGGSGGAGLVAEPDLQSSSTDAAPGTAVDATSGFDPGKLSEKELIALLEQHGIQVLDPDNPDRGGWTEQLTFPDGTEVEVVIRRPKSRYKIAGERDFGPVLETLRLAADNGDAIAAFTAASLMMRCVSVPSTADEYQAGELRVRKFHEDQGINPSQALERYYKTYDACMSVPEAERANAERWMERAAELGHTGALRDLADQAGETYEGYQLLERAWQQGDADALFKLSVAYRDGWASIDGEADPMMSYAYGYLMQYVWRPPITEGAAHTRLQELNASFERQGLLPDQTTRDAAIQHALQLLQGNSNCCIRPY